MRHSKKSVFEVHDIRGLRCLTKLRVKFSSLNEHRFRSNFDSISPVCACNSGIEDNEHFFLHCPIYDQTRNGLPGHLSDIPGLELGNLSSEALCEFLLCGNPRFKYTTSKLILEATISFILSTKRVE